MRRFFLKPVDVLIVCIAIVAVTGTFLRIKSSTGENLYAVITTGKSEYLYPLAANRELRIPGVLGDSVISIQGGLAQFRTSPCQNKICVHTGALSKNGDFAACLPNGVLMHIEER